MGRPGTGSRLAGDDDHADIVSGAARQRALHQSIGDFFHWIIVQNGGDLAIGERATQSIGAEQQSVAGGEGVPRFFERQPGCAHRRHKVLGIGAVSPFAIERNRPATFGHPLWSAWGDLRMMKMMWQGRDAELSRIAADAGRLTLHDFAAA